VRRSEQWTRRDWGVCAGLVALAAVPRFWSLGRAGLIHFDEGMWTLAARWFATLGREGMPYDPVRSPPLVPALEGLSLAVFGVHDWAAIAVSAAAGSLTAGLLYAVGKRWFGAAIGAAAAVMLSVAEYHLVFSRLALTDATFTLLFWAAVAAAFEAVRFGGTRRYLAAGVLTGLSMNAKYDGVLPLVLVAAWAAITRLQIVNTEENPPLASVVRGLALAAAVAAALYAPWALVVQLERGYGALLTTHAEHSVSTGLFPTSPLALWFYFGHWLSPALLAAAGLGVVAAFVRRGEAESLLIVVVLLFGGFLTLYLSFPRLALPLVPAACLFAALGLDALARVLSHARRAAILAFAAALVAVSSLPAVAEVLATRTDAYRRAAAYLRAERLPVVSQMSRCFYFYEDSRSTEMRFHTTEELDAVLAASPEILVAVDPIVERLPEAKAWFERTCAAVVPEYVVPISMYEPVYYQGFDPRLGFEGVPRSYAPFVPGQSEIRIYRISRPASPMADGGVASSSPESISSLSPNP
jgi:hypothetical protein